MNVGKVRKRAMLAALFVATVGGVGYLTSGQPGFHAIASALADPSSILADRSPGARRAGAMTNTKPAYARVDKPNGGGGAGRGDGFKPKERVLSMVRDRAPGDVAFDGDLPVPFASVAGPELGDLGRGTPTVTGTGGGGPLGLVPGGRGTGGGGGGGGTIPGGGGGVPEPAAWAMMLVGFFGIGGALRRRAGIAVGPIAGAR